MRRGGTGHDEDIFSESYDDLIHALQAAATTTTTTTTGTTGTTGLEESQFGPGHPHFGGYARNPYAVQQPGGVDGEDDDDASDGGMGLTLPPPRGFAPEAYRDVPRSGSEGSDYRGGGLHRQHGTSPSPTLSHSEFRRQSIADTHL